MYKYFVQHNDIIIYLELMPIVSFQIGQIDVCLQRYSDGTEINSIGKLISFEDEKKKKETLSLTEFSG